MTCSHGFIGACAECDGSGQEPSKEPECPKCSDSMDWSDYCGVRVCLNPVCNYHYRLARCYCGWSLYGNNGRQELEEMGETIEEED